MCAKILVLAEPPHRVQQINQSFEREYAICASRYLNEPAGVLFTNLSISDQISAIIAASRAGKKARMNLLIHTCAEILVPSSVESLPVVDKSANRVQHIILLFAKSSTGGSPPAVSIDFPAASPSDISVAPTSTQSTAQVASFRHIGELSAANTASAFIGNAANRPDADPVRPADATPPPAAPARPQTRTAVANEAVQAVLHLPMADAAARLGMSVSSLKTVCRRMGIRRWPRPPVAGPVDAAYVRRLLRKHGRPAGRGGSSGDDCAAAAGTPESGGGSGGGGGCGRRPPKDPRRKIAAVEAVPPVSHGGRSSSGPGETAGMAEGGCGAGEWEWEWVVAERGDWAVDGWIEDVLDSDSGADMAGGGGSDDSSDFGSGGDSCGGGGGGGASGVAVDGGGSSAAADAGAFAPRDPESDDGRYDSGGTGRTPGRDGSAMPH